MKEREKMKLNIIRGIIIILLIGTFYVIFGFSSQNGSESSGISKKITISLTENIKTIQEKPKEEQEKTVLHISLEKTTDILNQINAYLDNERKNLNNQ